MGRCSDRLMEEKATGCSKSPLRVERTEGGTAELSDLAGQGLHGDPLCSR